MTPSSGIVGLALIGAVASHALSAQSGPGPRREPLFEKGAIVTLVLPAAAIPPGSATYVSSTRKAVFTIQISGDGQHLVPNGIADWQARGFPILDEFSFEKIGRTNGQAEIEYRNANVDLKFRVPMTLDPATAVAPFLRLGDKHASPITEYLASAYDAIGARVFTGALSAIDTEHRRALLAAVHGRDLGAGARTVSQETVGNRPYLAADLGSDGKYYDTQRVSAAARLIHVISTRMFPRLKTLAAALGETPALGGVTLRAEILSADLRREATSSSTVDVYAPSPLVVQWAASAITDQQFLNGCTVIVDGQPTKISIGKDVSRF